MIFDIQTTGEMNAHMDMEMQMQVWIRESRPVIRTMTVHAVKVYIWWQPIIFTYFYNFQPLEILYKRTALAQSLVGGQPYFCLAQNLC